MAITVNKETCIGCGACASVCPNGFQLGDDGKSEPISQEDTECAKKASEGCPVQAIAVE